MAIVDGLNNDARDVDLAPVRLNCFRVKTFLIFVSRKENPSSAAPLSPPTDALFVYSSPHNGLDLEKMVG